MILTLSATSDRSPFTASTEQLLGLPTAVVPPESTGPHRDPATVALVALQIPISLLATWDLAERVGLLKRVQSWLDALRAAPGAEGVTVDLPGQPHRRLADLAPADVLDAANASAPDCGPDQLRWDAFLIHAGPDRATARRLWQALRLAGLNPYLDRANLRPTAEWPRRLAEAMRATRVFVVLVSERWESGWYNEDELARAVSLCREDPQRLLVPVILGERRMPAHELPYGVAHVQPVHLGGLSPEEGDAAVIAAVRGE